MSKFKLTPDVILELRGIAKHLPYARYAVMSSYEMSGADLKLSGYGEMPEYKDKLEDDKIYAIPAPAYYQVNHFRRMKKAYLREGVPGVVKYCKPYFDQEKLKQRNAAAKKN